MLSGRNDWLVVLGAAELDVGAVEVAGTELDDGVLGAVELDAGVLGTVELDAGVLGAVELDAGVLGTVELDAGVLGTVELDAGVLGTVELDAGVLGTVELDIDVLGDAEEHVVVGKNCPRVWPEACASTWTKHLPSADFSSGAVTPSAWLGPICRSAFH